MYQVTKRVKDVEPAINLMDLGELVKLIHKESDINFRNNLRVLPKPTNFGKAYTPDVTDK